MWGNWYSRFLLYSNMTLERSHSRIVLQHKKNLLGETVSYPYLKKQIWIYLIFFSFLFRFYLNLYIFLKATQVGYWCWIFKLESVMKSEKVCIKVALLFTPALNPMPPSLLIMLPHLPPPSTNPVPNPSLPKIHPQNHLLPKFNLPLFWNSRTPPWWVPNNLTNYTNFMHLLKFCSFLGMV